MTMRQQLKATSMPLALPDTTSREVRETRSKFMFGASPFSGAVFLTLLLLSPTLYLTLYSPLQFAADDFWHILAFEGHSYPGGPTSDDLFRFASGSAVDTTAGMQEGAFTWYTDPTLKIAFWRPLSAALHHLDYVFFGKCALGARLHSILWQLGLLFVTWRLYRLFLSARLAAVALVVFSCVAAHWQPVGYIAARNALVSATLATAALLYYTQWRRQGRALHLLLGLGLYVLAVSAGESAFGAAAYVAGYELVFCDDSVRKRLLGLAPFLGISACALVLYAALGYGTQHSGAYLNPLAEPRAFLADLPSRLASMLGFSYLGFPADVWFLEPRLRSTTVLLGILSASLMLLGSHFVWRYLDVRDRMACVWMGVASLGAMIPQAGGQLGSRSLTLPSLGTSVVIAFLTLGAWRRFKDLHASSAVRWLGACTAATAVLIHVGIASASWIATPFFYVESLSKTATAMEGLNLDGSANQTAMLLQVPDMFVFRYLPYERRMHGQVVPKAWHALSQANHDHMVRRTGPNSFELEVVDGQMFESPVETVSRPLGSVPEVGYRVELNDFSVRVLDVGSLGPRRIAVECRRPLDDPEWLFLVWRNERLQRFVFPEVGKSVRLPWSQGPTTLTL